MIDTDPDTDTDTDPPDLIGMRSGEHVLGIRKGLLEHDCDEVEASLEEASLEECSLEEEEEGECSLEEQEEEIVDAEQGSGCVGENKGVDDSKLDLSVIPILLSKRPRPAPSSSRLELLLLLLLSDVGESWSIGGLWSSGGEGVMPSRLSEGGGEENSISEKGGLTGSDPAGPF